MQETETSVAVTQPRKSAARCCPDDECGTALKNNYFEGKRLTPDAFRVEQRYLVERRRLLNRAIHGWGVVYGYPVEVEVRERLRVVKTQQTRANPCEPDDETAERRRIVRRRLKIDGGLALDACGRELVQVGCAVLDIDDVIVLDERGHRADREKTLTRELRRRADEPDRWCWQLEAHYAEQSVDPVQFTDPCRCERDEWDHVCETVRYSLRLVSCDECCREDDCGLHCHCSDDDCCHSKRRRVVLEMDETRAEQHGELEARERAHPARRRGGCRCICDHLTGLHPGEDCTCRLCEIDEACGTVRVDLGHGVPLACVDVVRDDCGDWTFGETVEVCGPRRFVKRNDLLYDLIQGCDLTRIRAIGWAKWHRNKTPMLIEEFLDALGYDGIERDEYITNDFWVEFSRPVMRDTLRPDCFAMTVLSRDERERWWTPNRVPIIGVVPYPSEPESGPHLIRGARIVVDGVWLLDAVRSKASVFYDHLARIEFEVRGDFILDCNGQAVDAEPIGLSPAPTGNRSPGGTFLSTFRVAKSREEWERRGPSEVARHHGVSR